MLSQASRRVFSSSRNYLPRNAPLRRWFSSQNGRRLSTSVSSISLSRNGCLGSHRAFGNLNSVRFSSSNAEPKEEDTEGVKEEEEEDFGFANDLADYRPTYITDAQANEFIARAKEVWPCPSGPIPDGWSCEWEKWPMLFSLYWFSPYYLMLPQIEMLVNITYGIPGEARPILYYTPKTADGTGKDLFVFTIVKPEGEGSEEFYLCDCSQLDLFKIGVPGLTEEKLVSMLGSEVTSSGSMPSLPPMEKLEVSSEGMEAIERILERDESVIPVLAEKFLGYMPEATEEWQERPESAGEDIEGMTEEENLEELKRLMGELEKRAPEAKEASEAFLRGLTVGGDGESVEFDRLQSSAETLGLTKELGELEEMMKTAEGDLENSENKAKNTTEESDDLGELDDIDLKELESEKKELQVEEVEEDHVKVSIPFKSNEK